MEHSESLTGCPPMQQPDIKPGQAVLQIQSKTDVLRPIWPQVLGVLLVLTALISLWHLVLNLTGLTITMASQSEFDPYDIPWLDFSWQYMLPIPIPGLTDLSYGASLMPHAMIALPILICLLLLLVWQVRVGVGFYRMKHLRMPTLRIWLLLMITASVIHKWVNLELFSSAFDNFGYPYNQSIISSILNEIWYSLAGDLIYTSSYSNNPWDWISHTFFSTIFTYAWSIWPQLLIVVFFLFPRVRQQIRQWP